MTTAASRLFALLLLAALGVLIAAVLDATGYLPMTHALVLVGSLVFILGLVGGWLLAGARPWYK